MVNKTLFAIENWIRALKTYFYQKVSNLALELTHPFSDCMQKIRNNLTQGRVILKCISLLINYLCFSQALCETSAHFAGNFIPTFGRFHMGMYGYHMELPGLSHIISNL